MKSSSTNQNYPLGIKDPVDLNDPVWTTSHIALFLNQRHEVVLSVVNSYGFPVPLSNQKRNRRWLAEDVRKFFEKRSQGEFAATTSYNIDKTQAPKSFRFKD